MSGESCQEFWSVKPVPSPQAPGEPLPGYFTSPGLHKSSLPLLPDLCLGGQSCPEHGEPNAILPTAASARTKCCAVQAFFMKEKETELSEITVESYSQQI